MSDGTFYCRRCGYVITTSTTSALLLRKCPDCGLSRGDATNTLTQYYPFTEAYVERKPVRTNRTSGGRGTGTAAKETKP